jgi:hypothetical protein
MSAETNEIIRLLLAQQQRQQQGRGADPHPNYENQQLYQQLGVAAPAAQQQHDSLTSGLGHLLANLIQGATNPAGGEAGPNELQVHAASSTVPQLSYSAVTPATSSIQQQPPVAAAPEFHTSQPQNVAGSGIAMNCGVYQFQAPVASFNTDSIAHQNSLPVSENSRQLQQQLIDSAKLLASINPQLAAATMEQALALGNVAQQPWREHQHGSQPPVVSGSASNANEIPPSTKGEGNYDNATSGQISTQPAPNPPSLLTLRSWNLQQIGELREQH